MRDLIMVYYLTEYGSKPWSLRQNKYTHDELLSETEISFFIKNIL